MTKEEAIKMLNECDDETGFIVVTLNKYDVAAYFPDGYELYEALSKEDRMRFLSNVADETYDMLEQGDDYGVGNVVIDALEGWEFDEILNRGNN